MTTPEYELSEEERLFQKYYERLMRETIHARAHLKLWTRLEDYKSSYFDELNMAPHFFTFTIKANLDDVLMTLSRILREQQDALTISKFLDFIKQNQGMFSTESFSRRIRGKPNFDEYWVESHKPITQKEIKEDRQKLENLERTINHLITWRDKVIAHIDAKFLSTGRSVSEEYPLQRQKLEEIIQTLVEILNRYSVAYESSEFLETFPNEDDVQFAMDAIRFYIQAQNKEL